MNPVSNRRTWIVGCVMAGVVGGLPARAADESREPAPAGAWDCYFLHPRTTLEKAYYSVWTFDAKNRRVLVLYSPVHKGFTYSYRWAGDRLALGHASGPFEPVYGTYKTQRPSAATLVVEDPRLSWQGWRCRPAAGEDWPADGLQFLDYTRYPWLASLIEDGPSIIQYRYPDPDRAWRQRIDGNH